jgi:hypothetical protein
VGCFEFEPLSGPGIQSVFDHCQLLIRDGFHAPILGSVLAQQTIEVLVGHYFHFGKNIDKNLGKSGEFKTPHEVFQASLNRVAHRS